MLLSAPPDFNQEAHCILSKPYLLDKIKEGTPVLVTSPKFLQNVFDELLRALQREATHRISKSVLPITHLNSSEFVSQFSEALL
jgi:hypothetical protein